VDNIDIGTGEEEESSEDLVGELAYKSERQSMEVGTARELVEVERE